MKYLFFVFLFFSTSAFSQLVFIGIDIQQEDSYAKVHGYSTGQKRSGIVKQGNHYFYVSPNSNLIETDGTEIGTVFTPVYPGTSSAYLFATNHFVYYGKKSSYTDHGETDLIQYDPITKSSKSNWSLPAFFNYAQSLELNDAIVPGQTYPVSEIFVGSNNDKIFIRTSKTPYGYTDLISHVYSINDNNPTKIYTVYENSTITPDGDMLIGTDARIADLGNDVFINGRTKPTGVYETSVLVSSGPQPVADTFKTTSYYELKKKGLTLFDGFLRTDTAIYSLISNVENGINKYSLWQYQGKSLTAASGNLIVQADDYATEVHDGVIYVSCRGYIFRLNEVTHNFKEIRVSGTAGGFQNISDKNRILKAGNYLMCNINGAYKIYNLLTANWSDAETPALPVEPNRYRLTPTYAYGTSENFVYFKIVDGKEQLVSYSPADNTTKTITFPEYDKEIFENICSFSQAGDKFFIVAAYSGKKNSKTYRMFMLSD